MSPAIEPPNWLQYTPVQSQDSISMIHLIAPPDWPQQTPVTKTVGTTVTVC